MLMAQRYCNPRLLHCSCIQVWDSQSYNGALANNPLWEPQTEYYNWWFNTYADPYITFHDSKFLNLPGSYNSSHRFARAAKLPEAGYIWEWCAPCVCGGVQGSIEADVTIFKLQSCSVLLLACCIALKFARPHACERSPPFACRPKDIEVSPRYTDGNLPETNPALIATQAVISSVYLPKGVDDAGVYARGWVVTLASACSLGDLRLYMCITR